MKRKIFKYLSTRWESITCQLAAYVVYNAHLFECILHLFEWKFKYVYNQNFYHLSKFWRENSLTHTATHNSLSIQQTKKILNKKKHTHLLLIAYKVNEQIIYIWIYFRNGLINLMKMIMDGNIDKTRITFEWMFWAIFGGIIEITWSSGRMYKPVKKNTLCLLLAINRDNRVAIICIWFLRHHNSDIKSALKAALNTKNQALEKTLLFILFVSLET